VLGGGSDSENKLMVFSSNNKIFVQNKSGKQGNLRVLDLMGRVVYNAIVNSENMNSFNVSLPTGSYIAKVNIGMNELIKPIIIK